jgi:AcrR family transcriptional regulator
MPRGFDEKERETIRRELLEAGTEIFGKHGWGKTSVEDIIRRGGVAKGTFYTFWDSKEEFFFACLEEAERAFRREMLDPLLQSPDDPAESLGRIVTDIPRLIADYPILREAMDPRIIGRLYRRLPPEIIERHQQEDRSAFADLVAGWKRGGFDPGIEGEVFDGLIKGFIMMELHREVIGEKVFPRVMELSGRLLAAGLRTLSDRSS